MPGDGVELISRGRRKFKGGNTNVPMVCTGISYSSSAFTAAAVHFVYFVYMVYGPTMRVWLLR